jgi:hypothetical protein
VKGIHSILNMLQVPIPPRRIRDKIEFLLGMFGYDTVVYYRTTFVEKDGEGGGVRLHLVDICRSKIVEEVGGGWAGYAANNGVS